MGKQGPYRSTSPAVVQQANAPDADVYCRVFVVLGLPSNMLAWLTAPGAQPQEYDALLEDKEHPYFEHEII
jgi:hypothetical protein